MSYVKVECHECGCKISAPLPPNAHPKNDDEWTEFAAKAHFELKPACALRYGLSKAMVEFVDQFTLTTPNPSIALKGEMSSIRACVRIALENKSPNDMSRTLEFVESSLDRWMAKLK